MSIAQAEWNALDRALDRLLDLDFVRRERELREIAVSDPDQARTLRRLLASLDSDDPIAGLAESTLFTEAFADVPKLGPGTQVGQWQVLSQLGAGGMAEVYQAERQIGDNRQVAALKVMALGTASEHAQSRFAQETGILARLEDPRLSRLIDAGRLADGRPWLAMEYVDGAPVDQAADQQRLNLRQRVELLIEVARALDQAHRLLVIHRDIKPANILLDRQGRPRVLDFGIAKLVDPSEADSDRTATIWQAYTLRFASPEQLTGAPTGVASDVFQLGLLLHLLLTGRRAYADCDDQPMALLQAIRRGPGLPSRLWLNGDAAMALDRRSTPSRLRREIAGDLDSIILRALQAEPQARYRGSGELADDLQRWLDGLAVQARSASRGYRARRWLRRYRLPVAASLLVLVMLAGYALMVMGQRDALEAERNRTQAVLDSLTEMFSVADPYADGAESVTVAEVVQQTADRLLGEPGEDPQVQAALLERLSDLAESNRDINRQIRLLQAAHDVIRSNDLDPAWAAQLMLNVAQAQAATGDYAQARISLDRALPDLNQDDRYSARLFSAQLLAEAAEKEAAATQISALLTELPTGPQHAARTANAHNSLALILGSQGKLAESAQHYRAALEAAPRDKPADWDLVGTIRSNLGVTLARQRRYAESEAEFRAVLEWREQSLGAEHPAVANAASVYSPLLIRTLRLQTASALMRKHYRPDDARHRGSYRWPDYMVNYARAAIYSGGHELAVSLTVQAAEALALQVPSTHPRMRKVLDYLAWWLFEVGEQELSLALAKHVDPQPADSPLSSGVLLLLLDNDQEHAELDEAIAGDPCKSVELTVLRAALAGEREFNDLTLPDHCEGLRAARLTQLGVRWQPDWAGNIQTESYSSPLARRLLGEEIEPLSEEVRQSVQALLAHVAPEP